MDKLGFGAEETHRGLVDCFLVLLTMCSKITNPDRDYITPTPHKICPTVQGSLLLMADFPCSPAQSEFFPTFPY